MSYIIEQKIGDRVYLYKVTSYWDKERKQPRQKREYIGPKERVNKPRKKRVELDQIKEVVSKSYGDIYLCESLFDKLGLTSILKEEFSDIYQDMINVSMYTLSENTSSYLYPYWLEEHYLPGSKKLTSTCISNLYEKIGLSERIRLGVFRAWSKKLAPKKGIYYDITSLSSYSSNIEGLEWGYNRDKEHLQQLNIGIVHCRASGLPMSYNVYPGSICDVVTLKNTVHMLTDFGMENMFFVLDRGFYSKANIISMKESGISFIQPIPLSLSISKELIFKDVNKIGEMSKAFRYGTELLYHREEKIQLGEEEINAHVFFNEKASISSKHDILSEIMGIEDKLPVKFDTEEEADTYLQDNIISRFRKYFVVQKEELKIVRDESIILQESVKAGSFIMLVNTEDKLPAESIIGMYRSRDAVEKDIDVFKNQLDGKRIRAHNGNTVSGRLFIKFLSMILHAKLSSTIKSNKSLKHYSVREILYELRKIKVNTFKEGSEFISEISKKQRTILEVFNIEIPEIL